MSFTYDSMMSGLPPEWPEDVLPSIRDDVVRAESTVVVLDDDPTGTQTVADVPILTGWSVDELVNEFRRATPLVFVLTNSRSMTGLKAEALAGEIGGNLRAASHRTDRRFSVISRSDSTLRGHFPGEVDALEEGLCQRNSTRIIIPFFLEGGRYTIDDIHYVREGDAMVPAGETPFARDVVFGYRTSNMREWVEEKTGGRITADSVVSISLDDIRRNGPAGVLGKLSVNDPPPAVVVNAAGYRDLEVVTRALIDAERRGMRFMYRTAASFVRVRAGLSERPLLGGDDLNMRPDGGGLIVVGSYVPRSSAQLGHLLDHGSVRPVELHVPRLLKDGGAGEIARVAAVAEQGLKEGADVAVYTSRGHVTGDEAAASLAIAGRVSHALVEVVRSVAAGARYVLAKGGVTSSDIATDALGIKRAWVLGQILPGVPVWRLGEESSVPGIPYIVFPGNVGDDDAVTAVVKELSSGG